MLAWHAGAESRSCGRCGEEEQRPVYVAPVLASEEYEDATKLPIDFFWAEGETAPAEGMTLADHEFPYWWASSPMYNNDPETRLDIQGAEISWEDDSILLSSLEVDDTLVVHIAVPEEYRDAFEDTDVAVTLIERGAVNPLS